MMMWWTAGTFPLYVVVMQLTHRSLRHGGSSAAFTIRNTPVVRIPPATLATTTRSTTATTSSRISSTSITAIKSSGDEPTALSSNHDDPDPNRCSDRRVAAINNSSSTNSNKPATKRRKSSPSPTTTARTTTSRRDALRRSAALASTTTALVASALTRSPPTAAASGSDPNIDETVFRPAKRATAYLVDSTIPPTLVPFRASREAAILKNLGNGGGTQKTPFIEEEITTNNVMNKAVFGTTTFITDTLASAGLNVEGDTDTAPTATAPIDGSGPPERRKKRRNEPYDATFLFLGLDTNDATGEDAALAAGIAEIVLRPRRRSDSALALGYAPLSTQDALDSYVRSGGGGAGEELVRRLVDAGVPRATVGAQMPLLEFARARGLKLLAVAPEVEDVEVVRRGGLQDLDPVVRGRYVADAEGFVRWTQDPKNKLYTERSLLKDYVPMGGSSSSSSSSSTSTTTTSTTGKENGSSVEDTVGGYFAERILVHETIATTIARYMQRPTKSKNALVITVAPIKDLRYLGGPNGRLPRILQALDPRTNVDDEAVTTILLNPSAETTLSKSRFLRLEIGTAPSNLKYQTKVADYLWFSRMPKVNMLPRMMNGF